MSTVEDDWVMPVPLGVCCQDAAREVITEGNLPLGSSTTFKCAMGHDSFVTRNEDGQHMMLESPPSNER